MALQPLAHSSKNFIREVIGRKDNKIGRLFYHWREIIGAENADLMMPYKIKFQPTQGYRLEVVTTSAVATRMIYRKAILLERLNNYLGFEITDIHFRHEHSLINDNYSCTKKAPNDAQESFNYDLFPEISNIEDPIMRERLESLGRFVVDDTAN